MGARLWVQRSCHCTQAVDALRYIPAEKLADLTEQRPVLLIEEEEESLCVYLQGGNTTVTTPLLLNLLTLQAVRGLYLDVRL